MKTAKQPCLLLDRVQLAEHGRWVCHALLELATRRLIVYQSDMHAIGLRMLRQLIVIALALALTSIGFAHRVGPSAMTPELAAYLAAGGQLSDLCGTADGEGQPAQSNCEACRISDTATVLGTPCTEVTKPVVTRTMAFVAKRIAERSDLDPARLTRAPPQA